LPARQIVHADQLALRIKGCLSGNVDGAATLNFDDLRIAGRLA
jgi:hypothetical protein